MAEIDVVLGKEFAKTVNILLKTHSVSPAKIKAIGSHGQTIRHYPQLTFTLQIGDPNIIAAETGITTVADFRRKDLAVGGVGAPLVPAFHQQIFANSEKNRAIVNIGGIANVTILADKNRRAVIGFDTGPGNVLMDAWIHLHQKKSHDEEGNWAKQGCVQEDLLRQLLADPYFQLVPPKSTGREYFNLAWLEKHLALNKKISTIDVQTTLAELTALAILDPIKQYFTDGEILICGGGTHNHFLMDRLRAKALPAFSVHSTEKYGVHPDWVEAMAFAWLAQKTLDRKPGNLPSVTGAKSEAVLGGIYY